MLNVFPNDQWSKTEGTGQYKSNTNILSEILEEIFMWGVNFLEISDQTETLNELYTGSQTDLASFNHFNARPKLN